SSRPTERSRCSRTSRRIACRVARAPVSCLASDPAVRAHMVAAAAAASGAAPIARTRVRPGGGGGGGGGATGAGSVFAGGGGLTGVVGGGLTGVVSDAGCGRAGGGVGRGRAG